MSIIPRPSLSDDSKTVNKQLPNSLLLRDYLLNDINSCSSNGFRSYPRRPPTSIRFLVQMELNKSETNCKSNLNSGQSSMLQRASTMMIKAFKHFPFIRSGNLSRKILKCSLWKKSDQRYNEVKQLKSLGDLLKETEVTRRTLNSKHSNSNSNSNSDNWSSSSCKDLTPTTTSSTTVNSFEDELVQNDVMDVSRGDELTNENRVGATNYYDITENTKKWQNQQDEQFSPVSVMDFPSDNDNDIDDNNDVSLMFQHRHLYVEGSKKFIHKARRFEGVLNVEPVKLEDRIAQSILESITQNVENVLLDFFKEKIAGEKCSDNETLQIAKDWMEGNEQEMVLEWECSNDRILYVTQMEEDLRWSKYDDEVEKNNISFELEFKIFNSLISEILREFFALE
ncbi:uncharacterized protein [Rutidosis leptorrhynchoides]|uniref:uncharacterized protein n=1 Tax=Rutidosis leptorrhynchoides TaxID=125765 RepID=UPI003A990C03